MIDLSIHNWKDALAAFFFVAVLPAYFLWCIADGLLKEFEIFGDWQIVKSNVWKMLATSLFQSLHFVALVGIFFGGIAAARYNWNDWVAIPLGAIAAIGAAGIAIVAGQIIVITQIFLLRRKYPSTSAVTEDKIDE